jgi:hypothetical protein
MKRVLRIISIGGAVSLLLSSMLTRADAQAVDQAVDAIAEHGPEIVETVPHVIEGIETLPAKLPYSPPPYVPSKQFDVNQGIQQLNQGLNQARQNLNPYPAPAYAPAPAYTQPTYAQPTYPTPKYGPPPVYTQPTYSTPKFAQPSYSYNPSVYAAPLYAKPVYSAPVYGSGSHR